MSVFSIIHPFCGMHKYGILDKDSVVAITELKCGHMASAIFEGWQRCLGSVYGAETREYGVSHIRGVATLFVGLYTVRATPNVKEKPLQL